MRSSHRLDQLGTAFDDDHLVADAGLLLPATLAHQLGLPCTRRPVRASSQALVAFDGSRYSVPVRHAGAALWLRAYATTVELWTATTIVASHPRATAKGTLTTDFWHYLPVLVRKPGAFANAIPVRQAAFPAEAQAILDALEAAHPDDRRSAHRAFLAICALGADVEPVRWRAACATALARGDSLGGGGIVFDPQDTGAVRLPKGAVAAGGLSNNPATSSGSVSWSWRVGSGTTKGTWPIHFTCAKDGARGSLTTDFTVR